MTNADYENMSAFSCGVLLFSLCLMYTYSSLHCQAKLRSNIFVCATISIAFFFTKMLTAFVRLIHSDVLITNGGIYSQVAKFDYFKVGIMNHFWCQ